MIAKQNAVEEMVSVDTDLLVDAIEFARKRAEEVHAESTHTMIDEIDDALWATWGDDDGNILVADTGGLKDNDPFDDDDLVADAA